MTEATSTYAVTETQDSSDEIKDVNTVSKDGGDYVVTCPHCRAVIGVEGDDLSEIRGEQYRCRCGRWLQVGYNARYVREFQ